MESAMNLKPARELKLLRMVAVPIAFILPLWLLLVSGFIIFVPGLAFLVWLIRQAKRKTSRNQWKLGTALFMASIVLSALIFRGLLGKMRRPEVFLLQQNYVGWFRVRWNIPKAAKLPLQNGRFILSIPTDGLLNTSTVDEEGWGGITFFYVDKNGHRTELPLQDREMRGPVVWGVSGRSQEQVFYVGTRKQFMNAEPNENGGKPKGAS